MKIKIVVYQQLNVILLQVEALLQVQIPEPIPLLLHQGIIVAEVTLEQQPKQEEIQIGNCERDTLAVYNLRM